MQAVALLILGAVLTVASLAIGYFPTDRATWRKVVLGLGLAGAALSFILGYKNLERALDLQKEVEHLKHMARIRRTGKKSSGGAFVIVARQNSF